MPSIDAGQHASRAAARQFAESLLLRIRQGEDFAKLSWEFDNGTSGRYRKGEGASRLDVLAAPARAQPVLFVSNETGTSISTVNTMTGAVGTYHTGLSNPDGILLAPDGNLYATSFTGGPYVWTTYERALQYTPPSRKMLSAVIAAPKPGFTEEQVVEDIRKVSRWTARYRLAGPPAVRILLIRWLHALDARNARPDSL